jgi:hypothetical protein
MTRYVLLVVLLAVSAVAQTLPDAPSYMFAASDPPLSLTGIVQNVEVPRHKFLDKGNRIRLLALAGLVAVDGITTQHLVMVDHGKEMNPLARPFVTRGAPGQAVASFLGYGLGTGTAFLFHRTNHHRVERIVLNLSIGIEAECVANNLVQIAVGKPRPTLTATSDSP